MNRRLSEKLLQAVLQSLQKGGRGFATGKPGPPRAVAAGGGSAKQPSAAAQAARAREKLRNVMEAPEMYKASGEELVQIERRNYITLGTLLAAVGAAYYTFWQSNKVKVAAPVEGEQLVNWSGTHEVTARRLYQPESTRELEALVAQAHEQGQKLRCVGSGLSPNGIGFCEEGMVSLALLDRIVAVDADKQQITVQAGARVQQVATALRAHGLTLQNYASIKEQTIGGFTQVGAHGTGGKIPPVDEQVVAMRLVTPAEGTLELSKDKDPQLFQLAKVGLGCLGVVSEVTLQCVPAERLVEHTFPSTLAQVKKNHAKWLATHKHLRYMWIPHTDTVIVVTNDPLPEGQPPPAAATAPPRYSEQERLKPLHDLLSQSSPLPAPEIAGLTGTQARDQLLALDPLNKDWVARVNQAEADYWRRGEGYRLGWSDELLGFDCGGQQWVLEVALPAGTLAQPDGKDIAYMEDLLKLVKQQGVAAPAPIEQRWTSGSSAALSPVHGPPDSLHSWVGIIMYLPDSPEQRQAVTASFRQYGQLVEQKLMAKYGAVEHWAKIELPPEPAALAELQRRVRRHYPVEEFLAARKRLDPENILGNQLVDALFGAPQA